MTRTAIHDVDSRALVSCNSPGPLHLTVVSKEVGTGPWWNKYPCVDWDNTRTNMEL